MISLSAVSYSASGKILIVTPGTTECTNFSVEIFKHLEINAYIVESNGKDINLPSIFKVHGYLRMRACEAGRWEGDARKLHENRRSKSYSGLPNRSDWDPKTGKLFE